jgi:hypothetical protein
MEMPQSELLYERIEILPNRETLALINISLNVSPSANLSGVGIVGVNNAAIVGVNNAIAVTAASSQASTQAGISQLLAGVQGF